LTHPIFYLQRSGGDTYSEEHVMAEKDDAVQHGVGRSFEILDQAWNAANAVGVASVFALDCVLVSPVVPSWTGATT
jgi:hypothetical protein